MTKRSREHPRLLKMSPSDRLVVQDDTKTLKSRRGDKKASIAVAHEILRACWHMLSTSETYREQGAEALRELRVWWRARKALFATIGAMRRHPPISEKEECR